MIYVITHKNFDDSFLDRNFYQVLHVGTQPLDRSGWFRDDTGDNIAGKNQSYCELTGLYWIWKNAPEKDSDVTGLVHYRRFFTTLEENQQYNRTGKVPRILSEDIIQETVKHGYILLPEKSHTLDTVYHTYGRMHYASDLDAVGESIHRLDPSYDKAFHTVMNAKSASYGNMFVTDRQTLNEYSSWLFSVLFDAESKIGHRTESAYQERVMGFLGERLLNVWILHSGRKTVYYPVFNTEEPGRTPLQLAIYRTQVFMQMITGRIKKR